MATNDLNQRTISTYLQDDYLLVWIEAFLIDRKAQNMSRGTLGFYQCKLKNFTDFCESKVVKNIMQITPSLLREYLLELEVKGHNPGGCHAAYRTVKTFLRWWENEVEPLDWSNPIRKVKAPKMSIEPLEPVDIEEVKAMMAVCSNNLTGLRDRAMMLFLLDTGVRASELVSINLEDVNPMTGDILVRIGKGRKPRTVYIGSKSRKSLRAYLKKRKDTSNALWITDEGERITYWGVKMIMKRRANQANVKTPELHAFRRWFALTCLRAGMNVYSLQELMGHADLQVLRRYLKQTNQDNREAHHRANPVDHL
jgi:site-specific recombinase XerD